MFGGSRGRARTEGEIISERLVLPSREEQGTCGWDVVIVNKLFYLANGMGIEMK